MPEVKLTGKILHKVEIIESERGWGMKVDEVKYFDTKEEAESYCKDFNKHNPTDHVPDWYMVAHYAGIHKV